MSRFRGPSRGGCPSQLAAAQADREEGNAAFKAGQYDAAERYYRAAIRSCDLILSLEEIDAADALKVRM